MKADYIKATAVRNITALEEVTAKAQSALSKMYADGKAIAIEGIPSELGAHNAAYKEQTRRVEMYSKFVFESGASGAKSADSIRDYIFKQLKADGYLRPSRELAADEKAERERVADANRKAKARAVAKAKADLKKAEPTRKWEEGELEELAAVHVADKKAETADAQKQLNAVARILEGTDSINVLKFPVNIKEGKYSDGAMPRTLAAFAAFLTTFKEESAE
jgi:hypothetical protein